MTQPDVALMDAMEERAERTLDVLEALDKARMMRVTREAIVHALDEELREERDRFRMLASSPALPRA